MRTSRDQGPRPSDTISVTQGAELLSRYGSDAPMVPHAGCAPMLACGSPASYLR